MVFNPKYILIYEALYNDIETTKEKLAIILDVSSIKTVESYIKNLEDVFYDINIRQYRFKELLPKYITINALNRIIGNSVVNKLLKNDFELISNNVSFSTNEVINTSDLSNLSKKLIIFTNAIKYNCVLKIEYKGLNKPLEKKYVEPHSYFTNGFTYYSYITYNERNEKNIGEERTLAFNSIGNIEAIEYVKDGSFKKDKIGNAYGSFKKDKFILLNIKNEAANFFKRELIFNDNAFELIDEELDGLSITVKMYYNHINEIVKLIKQWMPKISIFGNSKLKEEVYQIIKNDLNKLLEDS
jgi:hypothetical protein